MNINENFNEFMTNTISVKVALIPIEAKQHFQSI